MPARSKESIGEALDDFFEAWKSFFPLVFALEAKHFVFLKVHLLASLHLLRFAKILHS